MVWPERALHSAAHMALGHGPTHRDPATSWHLTLKCNGRLSPLIPALTIGTLFPQELQIKHKSLKTLDADEPRDPEIADLKR